jgi:hypothetical protein
MLLCLCCASHCADALVLVAVVILATNPLTEFWSSGHQSFDRVFQDHLLADCLHCMWLVLLTVEM